MPLRRRPHVHDLHPVALLLEQREVVDDVVPARERPISAELVAEEVDGRRYRLGGCHGRGNAESEENEASKDGQLQA